MQIMLCQMMQLGSEGDLMLQLSTRGVDPAVFRAWLCLTTTREAVSKGSEIKDKEPFSEVLHLEAHTER